MMIAGNRILNWVGAEEAHRKLVETLRMVGLDEQTLRAMEPDDRVEIVIYRSGRQYSGTITVGEAN